MITGVKFVNIPVTDQQRALEFYTEKLGLKILTDQPFDEKQRWIELKVPGAETRVVLFTAEGQKSWIGGFLNLTFNTHDVTRTYEQLKGRGVEFLAPPAKEEWGSYVLFKDSEGNQFCLSES